MTSHAAQRKLECHPASAKVGAGLAIASGVTPEYVWAAQLTTAGERGAVYGERMTPHRLALDAARLMLQQDLWGRATSSTRVSAS